jgi:hypothetical protein
MPRALISLFGVDGGLNNEFFFPIKSRLVVRPTNHYIEWKPEALSGVQSGLRAKVTHLRLAQEWRTSGPDAMFAAD